MICLLHGYYPACTDLMDFIADINRVSNFESCICFVVTALYCVHIFVLSLDCLNVIRIAFRQYFYYYNTERTCCCAQYQSAEKIVIPPIINPNGLNYILLLWLVLLQVVICMALTYDHMDSIYSGSITMLANRSQLTRHIVEKQCR